MKEYIFTSTCIKQPPFCFSINGWKRQKNNENRDLNMQNEHGKEIKAGPKKSI